MCTRKVSQKPNKLAKTKHTLREFLDLCSGQYLPRKPQSIDDQFRMSKSFLKVV